MNGFPNDEVDRFAEEIHSGRATVTVRIGGTTVTVSAACVAAAMATPNAVRDGIAPDSPEMARRTLRALSDLIGAVKLAAKTVASHGAPPGHAVSVVTTDAGTGAGGAA